MTKINRITIHGFKSFAHKTDIPFDGKFNCILGPNGSGKSNVGDALCFVLGRLSAKSMRAEKGVNLIFNGGKDKKPSSQAMVEIAFDNSSKIFPVEESEVVLTRVITKTGNSIYRINGKKRTRTEILDVMAAAKINPEGYNIILQGDITRFVDMHPLERRKIIEEISDVTIYEEKKHKAMLELEKVDEKLNNAEIILKERKTYLQELKKDRDQALKFKDLKSKVDSNKATLLHVQIKDKEEQKAKLDKEIEQHQSKITAAEQETEKIKAKILECKTKIDDINLQIEQRGEKAQVQVHRDIEDLKVALAKDKTRASTLKDEIAKIEQRKDQFAVELKELEEKSSSHLEKQKELQQSLRQKQRDLQELDEKIAQFKKKNKIESSADLEKQIEDIDKVIEQKQEEVQQVRLKQQELLRDKDKLEYQLQGLDERIKKVQQVAQENAQQVKELQQKKQDFKNATLRLNQCLDHDSGFASQISNARKRVQELQQRQAELNAKTLALQAGLSSNTALKSILENKKKFKGVFGTIAELGQVNKKYALPLEVAAGNKMQDIVVDSDATAAECISFLKNNKLGSASFVPLNKIHGREVGMEEKKLTKVQGAHDFAINLITYKPQFKKAFEYVFGNTLVVEDINVAREVGIGRIKMATVDGNIAEASGVMRGGFILRKSALGFKEQDSLEALEKIEKELGSSESVILALEDKREGNEKEIAQLRTKRAELEAELITLEKTLHLDDADLNATAGLKKELVVQVTKADQELQNITRQITAVNKDLAELKTKKQTLRTQVNELRDPRLLAQFSAFEATKQQTREQVLRFENDLKTIQMQVEQMFAPEREKIRNILKQHDKEESQFSQEIKELSSRVSEKEKELALKEKASEQFYAQYKELFTRREKMGTEKNKAESDIENLREKNRTHEREINLVSLKNAEVKARLAGLQEEFGKYKEVELFDGKSIQELQQEMARFEAMLTQMSAVNMKALEVYDQVEKEFNSLMEKKSGLEVEKTDVLTLMNEIETKKKDHFMKTFEKANENFQRIFNNLFKKGKAYLQLDNPNNPFEDGLSVKVKLMGNRFMDIKSLSGGEKTLTALSFIFAIQEYQPASFYILDEIDAALDKHNSETLSRLVRAYADRAQYILISHNDSIISEADTLFGVSMTDGVSKVTSLKI